MTGIETFDGPVIILSRRSLCQAGGCRRLARYDVSVRNESGLHGSYTPMCSACARQVKRAIESAKDATKRKTDGPS